MPNTTYEFRFQRGSSNRWEELNPILGSGEPGVEVDTGLFKIGDGSTYWNDLEYFLTEPYVSGLVEVIIAESGGLSADPRIGDLSNLTTTEKALLVDAINEVDAKAQAPKSSLVPFGRAGNLITFTGPRLYFPDPVEFLSATITLTTAPTGTSAIFQVLKNGVDVFSVDPAIAVSTFLATTGTLSGPATYLARTDYLQFRCTQIGSALPGADLTVALKMRPV